MISRFSSSLLFLFVVSRVVCGAVQSLDLLVFISFLFLFVLLHFLLQRETMSDEPSGVVEHDFCVFISSKLRRHLRNLEPKLLPLRLKIIFRKRRKNSHPWEFVG